MPENVIWNHFLEGEKRQRPDLNWDTLNGNKISLSGNKISKDIPVLHLQYISVCAVPDCATLASREKNEYTIYKFNEKFY